MKSTKPTKKDKKRVLDFLNEFDWFFGTQNYDRRVVFKEEDDGPCTAAIEVQEDYLRIYVSIYPKFWAHSKEDQREFLLHELCHYLITPLQQVAEELRDGVLITREAKRIALETSNCRVTSLINSLLKGKRKHFQKVYKKFLE